MKPLTLTEIFGDAWPVSLPQTLYELAEADPGDLPEAAKALRAQAKDAVRRDGLPRVATFADVVDLMSRRTVFRTWERKWRSYALDDARRPILVADGASTSMRRRWLVASSGMAPCADDLPKLSRRTYGPRSGWIVLYGGPPAVLDKPGVVQRLSRTAQQRTLLDVVFADGQDCWSVRNGVHADVAGALTPFEGSDAWMSLKGVWC